MIGYNFLNIGKRSSDALLVVLLLLSLLLAAGGLVSGLEKRTALLTAGGPRAVDLTTIRRQISEGSLSSQKALFYRKLRE